MSDWKNIQYKDGKMRTSEGGGGGGSSTFAGLDDVSFSDIQNGQVPKYNSTTQKWDNANESGGGHTYSTTEQVIGTWIDGKPIYEKTLNFGALPNNAVKDAQHGILNVDKIWISGGFAYQPNGDFTNQLSLCVPTALSSGWYFGVNSSIVRCVTGIDRSAYSAYVTIQYTKITD